MVEENPGFVEDEKGRPTVEPFLQPVEEIGQHWRDRAGLAHQRLGLEALDVGKRELLFGRIEQPAVRSFERVGLKRDPQCVRLKQQGEPGHRPLFVRCRCEAAERGPDRILHFGRDGHVLMGEQRRDPLRRPATLGRIVDVGERLEGQCFAVSIRRA